MTNQRENIGRPWVGGCLPLTCLAMRARDWGLSLHIQILVRRPPLLCGWNVVDSELKLSFDEEKTAWRVDLTPCKTRH